MSHSRKPHKARQRVKTGKQQAKDDKYWACGRKVLYSTEEEAQEVADRLGHMVYPCQ